MMSCIRQRALRSAHSTLSHLRKVETMPFFSTAAINSQPPKPRLLAFLGLGALACGLAGYAYTANLRDAARSNPRIFKFTAQDLQSDEAQWALYERWCCYFSKCRTREEMERNFEHFKDQAISVFEHNSLDLGSLSALNEFADLKAEDYLSPKLAHLDAASAKMGDAARSNPRIFKFTARDLRSDEAQWALYERWCNHFSMCRTREEMERNFEHFKDQAISVFEHNSLDLGSLSALNEFSDLKAEGYLIV